MAESRLGMLHVTVHPWQGCSHVQDDCAKQAVSLLCLCVGVARHKQRHRPEGALVPAAGLEESGSVHVTLANMIAFASITKLLGSC